MSHDHGSPDIGWSLAKIADALGAIAESLATLATPPAPRRCQGSKVLADRVLLCSQQAGHDGSHFDSAAGTWWDDKTAWRDRVFGGD